MISIFVTTLSSLSILGVFLYLGVSAVRALLQSWDDSRRKFPRNRFGESGTFGVKRRLRD